MPFYFLHCAIPVQVKRMLPGKTGIGIAGGRMLVAILGHFVETGRVRLCWLHEPFPLGACTQQST